VRQANPFLLSIGIHLTLIALLFGAINVVRKTIPVTQEKIRIKILTQSEVSTPSEPIVQPPQPKIIKPTPSVPKATQPLVTTPPKRISENKPITPTIQQPMPIKVPVIVSKAPEVTPVVVPKSPPPPPPKEEYKYPHKNSVESLLKQYIKCTKTMKHLRLRGTVIFSFDLTPNNDIINTKIEESSGNEILDNSVEPQIKSIASMFPKAEETVTFKRVPFEFKQCQ
jgi:TonB family protein